MPRRKTPEQMTAAEEIRAVLAWAERTGFANIAAALRRTLAKMQTAPPIARARRRS